MLAQSFEALDEQFVWRHETLDLVELLQTVDLADY